MYIYHSKQLFKNLNSFIFSLILSQRKDFITNIVWSLIKLKVLNSFILSPNKVRPLFKGGNYSREETINYQKVFIAETIQRRKVFKGGNYSRKYGMCFTQHFLKSKRNRRKCQQIAKNGQKQPKELIANTQIFFVYLLSALMRKLKQNCLKKAVFVWHIFQSKICSGTELETSKTLEEYVRKI